LLSHQYEPGRGRGATSYGTSEQYQLGTLEPTRHILVYPTERWLNVDARVHNPGYYNVMEFRLSYRRPPDMAHYASSAFYFLNPNGNWVREDDGSVKSAQYELIKDMVLRTAQTVDAWYPERDILHTQRLN